MTEILGELGYGPAKIAKIAGSRPGRADIG
jgi:hypothetical protein